MRTSKTIVLFVTSIFLASFLALPCAGEVVYSEVYISELIEKTVEYLCESDNCSSAQNWIDESLSRQVGSSEWSLIALSQTSDTYDFTSFRTSAITALTEGTVTNPVTELKCALALLSVMPKDDTSAEYLISKVIDKNTGTKGIMSYVYALHLLNNGCTSRIHTNASVISSILELQLDDGGWAVTGNVCDVDVTAMTVQALAPHYESNSDIKTAIDSSLLLLSEKQLSSGGFSSYGTENPESTAQVIIALASLGIDPATDTRFIKNGRSPLDALDEYHLETGGYSHEIDGDVNRNATEQALCALVAYERFISDNSGFYILDRKTADIDSVTETVGSSEILTDSSDEVLADSSDNIGIKEILQISVISIGILVCVVLMLTKKAGRTNLIITIVIAAVLLTIVTVSDISTPSEYYSGGKTTSNLDGKITFSIKCDEIVGNDGVPSDGIIVSETKIDFSEGDTVYDILISAAKDRQIVLDINGANEESAYITGIDNIYEAEYGDLSGWVYLVNGEVQSVGCGNYAVNDGDIVEWQYTLDLGNDITE